MYQRELLQGMKKVATSKSIVLTVCQALRALQVVYNYLPFTDMEIRAKRV